MNEYGNPDGRHKIEYHNGESWDCKCGANGTNRESNASTN